MGCGSCDTRGQPGPSIHTYLIPVDLALYNLESGKVPGYGGLGLAPKCIPPMAIGCDERLRNALTRPQEGEVELKGEEHILLLARHSTSLPRYNSAHLGSLVSSARHRPLNTLNQRLPSPFVRIRGPWRRRRPASGASLQLSLPPSRAAQRGSWPRATCTPPIIPGYSWRPLAHPPRIASRVGIIGLMAITPRAFALTATNMRALPAYPRPRLLPHVAPGKQEEKDPGMST